MSLRIAVCLASVIEPGRLVDGNMDRQSLLEGEFPQNLNPADANALEVALQTKDTLQGTEVIALTLGPQAAEEPLREAAALGIDRAVRLWGDSLAGSDCLATARVLAAAIRRLECDLVLCGAQSVEGMSGSVGPQLAEMLGIPAIPSVLGAKMRDDGSVLCERRAGGGIRASESVPLPALCTVEQDANSPRYPTLKSRLHWRSAPVECWGLEALDLRPEEVGAAGSVLQVTALLPPAPDMRDLVVPPSDMPAFLRLAIAVSGGVGGRGGGLVEGPPEELAERVLDHLKSRHLL
jgi:electron transfer flavoprotein beta subunit